MTSSTDRGEAGALLSGGLAATSSTKYRVLPREEHIQSREIVYVVVVGAALVFGGLIFLVAQGSHIAAAVFLLASLVAVILETKL